MENSSALDNTSESRDLLFDNDSQISRSLTKKRIIKENGCKECLTKISCTKLAHMGRPSWIPLHFCMIFFALFGFCFVATGFFYLPDYLNGNGVNATIVGYNVRPDLDCLWIAFAIISYNVKNVTYIVNNKYEFSECGNYDWAALNYAKIAYPQGSNVTVWYMNANPAILAGVNPKPLIVQLIVFSCPMALAFLVWIFHFFTVWCCGFHTWCCPKRLTLRCYDPFNSV